MRPGAESSEAARGGFLDSPEVRDLASRIEHQPQAEAAFRAYLQTQCSPWSASQMRRRRKLQEGGQRGFSGQLRSARFRPRIEHEPQAEAGFRAYSQA
mgnify:CR=1 FL=1